MINFTSMFGFVESVSTLKLNKREQNVGQHSLRLWTVCLAALGL